VKSHDVILSTTWPVVLTEMSSISWSFQMGQLLRWCQEGQKTIHSSLFSSL